MYEVDDKNLDSLPHHRRDCRQDRSGHFKKRSGGLCSAAVLCEVEHLDRPDRASSEFQFRGLEGIRCGFRAVVEYVKGKGVKML